MFDVMYSIHACLAVVFKRHGYVRDDGTASESENDDNDDEAAMPFRPRAPKAYRRKGRLAQHPSWQQSDPDKMCVGRCNVRSRYGQTQLECICK